MKVHLKIALASSIILLLIFLTTSPEGLPPVLLTAPFLLLFVALLFGALDVLGRWTVLRRSRNRIAVLIATAPVTLLVLQSLGQLTIKDVLVISVLFIVGYFYVSRFVAQPVNRQ